jgi:hypothetical protein
MHDLIMLRGESAEIAAWRQHLSTKDRIKVDKRNYELGASERYRMLLVLQLMNNYCYRSVAPGFPTKDCGQGNFTVCLQRTGHI